MHAPAAAVSRRSLWAGLDALVLEEIEALRKAPPLRPPPAPATGFASDEEFMVRTLRYLAVHPDPAALVASLSAGFPPAPEAESGSAATIDEEPAAAAVSSEEASDPPGEPAAGEGEEEGERP
jgi:hypothetical protein